MGHIPTNPLERRLRHPPHQSALAYWADRCRSVGGTPGRRDIDPLDIPELLPWVNLVDVFRRANGLAFRHRLVGTAIVEMWNRDSTGLWFHELYAPEKMARVQPALEEAVLSTRPRLVHDDLGEIGKPYWSFTSLVLPLASDRRNVDMLMLVSQYE
ncbi:hypothetical protein GCM10017083_20700 [Thalassobaculum fulvum]|uniref:PAS domain-containing protein n=1 Tax=Thalassobaculum fulvum TaxID=1633335 RepID=A0A918XSP5_9PROT|nr:PAS domain-containing protein [Thalassobaculum fulvum]GHD48971.1 hypothetical protein GCM10017083_20700 [Thalassobaculum fulvum]